VVSENDDVLIMYSSHRQNQFYTTLSHGVILNYAKSKSVVVDVCILHVAGSFSCHITVCACLVIGLCPLPDRWRGMHFIMTSMIYHVALDIILFYVALLINWLTDNLCSLLKTFYSRKTECTWHIRSGCNDALYGFMFTLVAFYILESQCGWLSWHHTNLWMKNDPG